MDRPTPNNQQFSEKTLKGFLLKNVDPTTTSPIVQLLNQYLIQRVDIFWNTVIVPLCKETKFNGNKINWYFEIYKEGLEAHKVNAHPFTFVNVSEEKIKEIVNFFEEKTILQYLELGTSFLSNCFSLLSSWYRDQLVLTRLKHIYYGDDPYQWILRAEAEEHGVMKQRVAVKEVADIIRTIELIISRRI